MCYPVYSDTVSIISPSVSGDSFINLSFYRLDLVPCFPLCFQWMKQPCESLMFVMSLWLRLKENARQEAQRAQRLSLDLQRKEDDTSDLRDKLADYKKQIQQVQKEVSKSAYQTATTPCWYMDMDQSKNSKCTSNKCLLNTSGVLQSMWDEYWVMGWSITVNSCQALVAKLLACGHWHPTRFQFQLSLTKTDLFISNYTHYCRGFHLAKYPPHSYWESNQRYCSAVGPRFQRKFQRETLKERRAE